MKEWGRFASGCRLDGKARSHAITEAKHPELNQSCVVNFYNNRLTAWKIVDARMTAAPKVEMNRVA